MSRTTSRTTGRAARLLAAVLVVGALTSCSGSDVATAPVAATTDLQLVTGGKLTIGTDPTYPPMEFQKDGKLTGVNVDLLTDLAHRLGLEPVFTTVSFADLRPAAAAHSIDVVGASMTDKADRQADVDFVDYFVAGAQVLVTADSPLQLTSPADWCGLRAATTSGTTDGDIVEAQSRLCEEAGKAPVTFVDVPYTKSAAEVLAGRADFGVEDLPAASYLVATSGGELKAFDGQLQPQPYGYGFAKDRTALRDALQVALQEAIADGTYAKILEQYDVAGGALRTTAVNGGA